MDEAAPSSLPVRPPSVHVPRRLPQPVRPLALAACALVPALHAQDARGTDASALVDRAAARRAPAAAYVARMETATLIAVRGAGGREAPHTAVRSASVVDDGPGGAVAQRVLGVRVSLTAAQPGDLRALRGGWWIPSLAGETFALRQPIARPATSARTAWLLAQVERIAAGSETLAVVHPLARDRWRYYVATDVGAGHVSIVPRGDAPRDRAVFRGAVRVDTATGALVAGRGRVDLPDGRVLGYVEWRDASAAGPPAWQRITLRHGRSSPFDPATRLSIVTRLVADGTPPVAPAGPAGLAITVDTGAALRAFTAWMPPLDAAAGTTDGDLADLLPDAEREVGRPRVEFDGTHTADVFRFNRVEGAFTGLAVRARFRDAAPGVEFRTTAGWAWSERTARGRITLVRDRGDWRTHVGAARLLDPTDDFRAPHDSGATWPALAFSTDPFDYVDRRVARVGILRRLGGRGPAVGVQLGTLDDRAVRTHVEHGITGGPFRPVRGITPGHAVQVTAWLEHHPDAWTALPAHAFGARVRYDQGDGSIAWRRLQGSAVVHRPLTATLGLQLEGHAGALLGGRAIPQQLFEVGGGDHLAAYRAKEFAGDRIAIARATLVRRLPWLRRPIPVVGGWMLPAPAPQLAAGVNTAWTGASAAGRAAMAALGPRYDSETGLPVRAPDGSLEPASRTTDGLRATTSLGLRLFGGAVFGGVACVIDGRPDAPRGLRWAVGFGGVL